MGWKGMHPTTVFTCAVIYFFNRSMLAYIMVPMMQRELDEFRLTIWNTHRIRAQKKTLMADGIPDHIFEFPERYGMEKKGYLSYIARMHNVLSYLYKQYLY